MKSEHFYPSLCQSGGRGFAGVRPRRPELVQSSAGAEVGAFVGAITLISEEPTTPLIRKWWTPIRLEGALDSGHTRLNETFFRLTLPRFTTGWCVTIASGISCGELGVMWNGADVSVVCMT